MANTYDIGDKIRVSVAFTDANDAASDPTTVTFKVKDPSGNTTTYVYNTDAEVVKDSTGNYHVDITTDEAGLWAYRFAGTGAQVAAAENNFYVRASYFT